MLIVHAVDLECYIKTKTVQTKLILLLYHLNTLI